MQGEIGLGDVFLGVTVATVIYYVGVVETFCLVNLLAVH